MKSKREQRHASIVFDHGTPVAFGFNDEGNHAEDNAINFDMPISIENKKGMIMVNIRLTRAGRIALARPCPSCYELLKEKKFRKVIYSTNDGGFTEEYL